MPFAPAQTADSVLALRAVTIQHEVLKHKFHFNEKRNTILVGAHHLVGSESNSKSQKSRTQNIHYPGFKMRQFGAQNRLPARRTPHFGSCAY